MVSPVFIRTRSVNFPEREDRGINQGDRIQKNILLPADGLGKWAPGIRHGAVLAHVLGVKITTVLRTGKLAVQEILEMDHPEVLFGPSDMKERFA